MQSTTTLEASQLASFFTTATSKHQHLRTLTHGKTCAYDSASKLLINGDAKVTFKSEGSTVALSTTGAAVFHHRYNVNYTSVGRIVATSYCFPGEERGSRDISRNY